MRLERSWFRRRVDELPKPFHRSGSYSTRKEFPGQAGQLTHTLSLGDWLKPRGSREGRPTALKVSSEWIHASCWSTIIMPPPGLWRSDATNWIRWHMGRNWEGLRQLAGRCPRPFSRPWKSGLRPPGSREEDEPAAVEHVSLES